MARRAGMTFSEYCRQMCLTGRVLSAPRLTAEEISYFKALKEHNTGLSRIANLIRTRSPELLIAIEEYLDKSRELYNRFF